MNRPRNQSVPTVQHVRPGTPVFIVLKADQSTGRETRGIVQDVLTSSPRHPRGIKVRLRDGQVGRVQRLDDSTSSTVHPPAVDPSAVRPSNVRNTNARHTNVRNTNARYTDARLDQGYYDDGDGPPPRSLADYMPQTQTRTQDGSAGSIECPICEAFEGDETAVTYHIDQEHLQT